MSISAICLYSERISLPLSLQHKRDCIFALSRLVYSFFINSASIWRSFGNNQDCTTPLVLTLHNLHKVYRLSEVSDIDLYKVKIEDTISPSIFQNDNESLLRFDSLWFLYSYHCLGIVRCGSHERSETKRNYSVILLLNLQYNEWSISKHLLKFCSAISQYKSSHLYYDQLKCIRI